MYRGEEQPEKRLGGVVGMLGVLIVDNNVIFRNLLWETLHAHFPTLDLYQASNGKEALETVENSFPDLIFMDIELDGENGFNVIRKIKSEQPDIRIAVLTSYDLPEYEEAARQHKVDYFLTKGVSTQEDILEVVDAVFPDKRGS